VSELKFPRAGTFPIVNTKMKYLSVPQTRWLSRSRGPPEYRAAKVAGNVILRNSRISLFRESNRAAEIVALRRRRLVSHCSFADNLSDCSQMTAGVMVARIRNVLHMLRAWHRSGGQAEGQRKMIGEHAERDEASGAKRKTRGRGNCNFIFVSFLSDIPALTRGPFLHHYVRSPLSLHFFLVSWIVCHVRGMIASIWSSDPIPLETRVVFSEWERPAESRLTRSQSSGIF
jgi:hypothetical protein